MKKGLMAVAMAGLLCIPTVAADAGTGISVGGFGGLNFPIEQDDADNGNAFGIRVRLALTAMAAVEPNIMLIGNGDYEMPPDQGLDVGEVLDPFESHKMTAYGVNLVFGGPDGPFQGLRFLGVVGAKAYSMDFPATGPEDETKIGWNAAIGFEFGSGKFSIDLRAGGEVVPTGDGSSRKHGIATAGLNFWLSTPDE